MPVPLGVVPELTGKIVNATKRVTKNPNTKSTGVTLSSFTLDYLVSNLSTLFKKLRVNFLLSTGFRETLFCCLVEEVQTFSISTEPSEFSTIVT